MANLTEEDKTRIRVNKASAERVGAENLRIELDLFTTKWFDYRYLSPAEATDAFSIEYTDCFRMAYRSNFDRDEAPKKQGLLRPDKYSFPIFPDEKANLKREYTQIWICRQAIDELGIPYRHAIKWAIEAHMRDGYHRIPRPNQLFAGPRAEATLKYVVAKWHECHTTSRMFSKLPQYKNENFCNQPAQVAHREWVQAELRAGQPHSIGRSCYIDRVLPEEMPLAKWGEERLERARQDIAGDVPVPQVLLGRDQLRQTCFGVPFAFNLSSPVCRACPDKALCENIDRILRAKFVSAHGVENPRLAEIRTQNNKRQVHRRAKVAALKSAAKAEATPASIEA